MKRIIQFIPLIICIIVAEATLAQNPKTQPKIMAETGLRYSVTDTAGMVPLVVFWGESYFQGVGATGDSILTTRFQNISNMYAYNRGVGGETSTQIKTRFLAQPELRDRIQVFSAGRNNFNQTQIVLADIREMVDSVKKRHNRYVVLSVPNGGGEPSGGTQYNQIKAINDSLAIEYGEHYLDWRAYIVSQYDPSIPADVTNHSQDIPPLSKRNDSLHFNNRGQDLQAKFIYNRLNFLFGKEFVTTYNLKQMMKNLRLNTANDSLLFGPIQVRGGNIGFNSTSYSDRFTLGGGGSANTMAIYNTVDETTNYERLRIQALGTNGYNFTVQAGGTGSQRDMVFTTQNSGIRITGGVVTGAVNVSRNLSGGNAANFGVLGTHSATTGFTNGLAIYNTVSTTSTGGYNGLIVSPAFTSMGSGTHYLLNLGVNGSANGGGPHRVKFAIDTSGRVTSVAPDAYSTGGYDVIARNQTSGRWESVASSGFVYTASGGISKAGNNFTDDLITPTSGSKAIIGGTGSSDQLTIRGNNNASTLSTAASLFLQTASNTPINALEVYNKGGVKIRDFGLYTVTIPTNSDYNISQGNGAKYYYTGTGAVNIALPTTPDFDGWTCFIKNMGTDVITLSVLGGGGNKIWDTSAVSSVTIAVGESRTLTWVNGSGVYSLESK